MSREAWIVWLNEKPVAVRDNEEAARWYAHGLVPESATSGILISISGPHTPESGEFRPSRVRTEAPRA